MHFLIIPKVIRPSVEPSFVISDDDDEEEGDQDQILEAAKRYDWDFPFSFNHTPCVSALQLTLQPFSVPAALVLKNKLTILLVLVMLVGRVEPQAFSNKAVPSPSVIVR